MRKIFPGKLGIPTTLSAMEGKDGERSTDPYKTFGTVHFSGIAPRGVFAKGRSHVLDKLLFCRVSRYLLFKVYYLCFRFSKFLLGTCMGFSHYVHLLAYESNPLSEYRIKDQE
ncbi:hypothetical protein ACVSDK_004841 [Escherichia coli]